MADRDAGMARDGRAAAAARRRGSRRAAVVQRRWVREVRGILALALAGFALIALWSFNPGLHALDQTSPVGPVGGWLGWGAFWAFGYAGYLFPLLLALYGVGAFIRSRLGHGWPALAGLVLLLVSATGGLARLSDTPVEVRIHKGGVLGWAVAEALESTVGAVGTWIILAALVPVGALARHAGLPRGARGRPAAASCRAGVGRRARRQYSLPPGRLRSRPRPSRHGWPPPCPSRDRPRWW